MHRLLIIVLFLLGFVTLSQADTTWVADSLASGSWSVDHSPYMIQRSISVRSSDTLLVGPGVTIRFTGPYRLNVMGILRALGTVSDSIRFTIDTVAFPSRWRGLRFLSAHDSCRMDYCLIENGSGAFPGDDRYGGGIECQTCRPTFSHCSIRNCRALLDGGGAYFRDNAAPRMFDCEIANCVSTQGGGGGLFSRFANPQLTRCSIRNNRASLTGGGIAVVTHSSPLTFADCLIEGNMAAEGGGLYMRSRMITISIQSCIIRSNTALRGGAEFDSSVATQFVNCLLVANNADSGSAVYSTEGSRIALNFCTLPANSSSNMTLFGRGDTLSLTNSLIAPANRGKAITLQHPGTAQISYCNFQADTAFSGDVSPDLGIFSRVNVWGDSCDSFLNLLGDPYFVNADSGNYRLADSSRCLGAAWDPNHLVTLDLDSLTRSSPVGSRPDMGAYENRLDNSSASYLIGSLHGVLGPGHFLVGGDIVVNAQDTVDIAAGTSLTFISRSRFILNGLLRANGTVQDSIFITADTLADPLRWLGIEFHAADPGCSMAYCRISFADSGNIRIFNCSPAFDHCAVDHGRGQTGGGLFARASNTAISDCDFNTNTASSSGGAMYFEGRSRPRITTSLFRANSATISGTGGAVALVDSSDGTFSECVFRQNTSSHFGGAVYCSTGGPLFDHCVFYENTASAGGAVALSQSLAAILRCTLDGNIALPDSHSAGGIYSDHSQPLVSSTIISFSHGCGIVFSASSRATVRACDLFGNATGSFGYSMPTDPPLDIGVRHRVNIYQDSCDAYLNTFVNPLFADTAARDFHLTGLSHCIDAGDSALSHDPDSTIADIGAFYFAHTVNANPRFSPYPLSLSLSSAPNPFNPVTQLRYDLPKASAVTLKIFNIMGREVATLVDKRMSAGSYLIEWNAATYPSGTYFAVLHAGEKRIVQKMLLMK